MVLGNRARLGFFTPQKKPSRMKKLKTQAQNQAFGFEDNKEIKFKKDG